MWSQEDRQRRGRELALEMISLTSVEDDQFAVEAGGVIRDELERLPFLKDDLISSLCSIAVVLIEELAEERDEDARELLGILAAGLAWNEFRDEQE